MYLNVCVCNEFFGLPEIAKNEVFDFSGTNLRELGLFHPYFVCKCSFREISMIKIIILNQNKLIWLILKNKKSKIQKSIICKLHVYYSLKWK